MAFKMNIKLPLRGEFLLISRFEIVSSINFSKNQLEIGMIFWSRVDSCINANGLTSFSAIATA